jgi:hypoxanthine phosphoribosyltransferase
MNRVKLHDKYFAPYIGADKIYEAVDRVADAINADFLPIANNENVPILLPVLNGSIIFCGHLLPKLKFPLELCGIRVQSYSGTSSTGNIKELLGLNIDVAGRDVIIVEDIVDTGNTIIKLCKNLEDRGAKRVKICTLATKPDVYDKDRNLDYVGLEIENKFIVGWGFDYDQLGRNLDQIYILDENQND